MDLPCMLHAHISGISRKEKSSVPFRKLTPRLVHFSRHNARLILLGSRFMSNFAEPTRIFPHLHCAPRLSKLKMLFNLSSGTALVESSSVQFFVVSADFCSRKMDAPRSLQISMWCVVCVCTTPKHTIHTTHTP